MYFQVNTDKHPPVKYYWGQRALLTTKMSSNRAKIADIVNPGILSRVQTIFAVLGGAYVLVVLLLMVPFIQSQ